MTDKPAHYYEHYNKDNNEATGLLEEEEATALLDDNSEEATSLLIDSGTTAQLLRILTNERIVISKPVFRIGKEPTYSDYRVTNNDKVSRSHADIIQKR